MKYISDNFKFIRRGLFTAQMPIDATNETHISGFSVAGTEPTGTARRIIFKVDEKFYKLNGNIPVIFGYKPTTENILSYGNTVAEVVAAENIQAWVGKKIFPLIALEAPASSPVMPTIKISLKTYSFNDVYTKMIESPVFDLRGGKVCKMLSCTPETVTTGNASLVIQLRYNTGAAWSDWVRPSDIINKPASQVQFRANYILTTLNGTDSAKLNSVTLNYADGELNTQESEIFTQTFDCGENMLSCYLAVKHSELIDAAPFAKVCFARNINRIDGQKLGTGAGITQTFQLAEGADFDSLELQAGDENVVDYYFDAKNSTVTFDAPQGVDITASYNAGLTAETWHDMQLAESYFDGENYVSRFVYALDVAENSQRVTCRLGFKRERGKVENQNLGKATGIYQKFLLAHKAIEGSITINASYKYFAEGNYILVKGNIDEPLILSYDWEGEPVEVIDYAIGMV